MFRRIGKPNFRKWIELEEAKKSIAEATEIAGFPDKVFGYLSIAFDRKPKEGYWKTSVFSFMKALERFHIDIPIPMIKNPPRNDKEAEWEYEGRAWFHLSSILAGAYGWTLDYIANLNVVEAFGHIQEILTEKHLEQEFYYSLSELAYPYNKSTKKGEFKPMPRPHWMRPVSRPVKRIRIRRDMAPMGVVIDVSRLGAELGGWNEIITKNEKTEPSRDAQAVPPPS